MAGYYWQSVLLLFFQFLTVLILSHFIKLNDRMLLANISHLHPTLTYSGPHGSSTKNSYKVVKRGGAVGALELRAG